MFTTLVGLGCFAVGLLVMRILTPEVNLAEEHLRMKIKDLEGDVQKTFDEFYDHFHERVSTIEDVLIVDSKEEVVVDTIKNELPDLFTPTPTQPVTTTN